MGLSRSVSDINGDFSGKSQIFPTPVYLTPPLKGFPLVLGVKKTSDRATGPKKKLDNIFSAVDKIHELDGRTDRWTSDDSKDRA